jgi:F-type H+-transporting ATPase subunit gamma
LLTENRRRVSHLGDAVRHLDQRCLELTHQANALRQEQTTEEIEVLLLSAGSAGGERKLATRSKWRKES